jgi:hypothetical protein
MYDTTRQSLHKWFVHEFEHLGWMVLAKAKSLDETRSEQERNLMKNKVNVYCEAITGLRIALQEKIGSLNNDKDSADIEDLNVLLKNVKILQAHVNATLMGNGLQMGGKRRSRKSKK